MMLYIGLRKNSHRHEGGFQTIYGLFFFFFFLALGLKVFSNLCGAQIAKNMFPLILISIWLSCLSLSC